MIQPPLVFDLGMNTGTETAYYLSRGWRVVALEANPRQMRHWAPRFANNSAVQLVNRAIGSKSGRVVTFCTLGAFKPCLMVVFRIAAQSSSQKATPIGDAPCRLASRPRLA